MSALLLFDIDGTLLLSGGAGVRAMTRAFEMVFGVPDAFAGIPVAGRTDRFLLSSALERAGLSDTPEARRVFREKYVDVLPTEMNQPGKGPKCVMPGVKALLDAIAEEGGLYPALLTGNYEPAAHIKLSHFGLATYFTWGAFGEESEDRDELARLAIRRAEERSIPGAARRNVVVVGDTPHDVTCARAIGARAIAVATGGYSIAQLEQSGADTVLPNLADHEALLSLL